MATKRIPGVHGPYAVDVKDGTLALANMAAPGHDDETGGEHDAKHGHHEHSTVEKLAHYAHALHLSAEGVEHAAEALEESIHFIKHVEAARSQLKGIAQMAFDLRRMGSGILKLENAAKGGGRVGAKAGQKLMQARLALKAACDAFEKEKAVIPKAQSLVTEFNAMQRAAKGAAYIKLAKTASEFEGALQASTIGRGLLTTGRLVSSKVFIRGLGVVGVALDGVSSYADSTAQTTSGKAANAALGAGSSALIILNPVVAGVDLITPANYKLSVVYHGGAGAVTAIGEGLLTNDTKAMDDFHRKSMEGRYGKIMQTASEAGEYWAEKGVGGGLKEFADSIRWWASL